VLDRNPDLILSAEVVHLQDQHVAMNDIETGPDLWDRGNDVGR
jgi:hypothetical protein